MVSDDTIPQITEGDEYMNLAITPTSAANILNINTSEIITSSGGANFIAGALFQDATANALVATMTSIAALADDTNLPLSHSMIAATTSSTTFRVRGGGNAGITTFNGSAGARKFGGVMNSFIEIQEIMG
jgi:hypothetical protein